MPLIIVESPNKVKKIAQYSGMKVLPTVGHFKDLPSDNMGVDLENNYTPTFKVDAKKKEVLEKIKAAAKGEVVYIASDPDREGYAIGTFVYQEILKTAKTIYRMEIHEVTETAIKKAIKEAVPFDKTNQGLFHAFLGRRVGDRVVGYVMSPIANKNIPKDKGTVFSVGRVQSPAVRLVVDREREIKNFKPESFWFVAIELVKGQKFYATHIHGKFTEKVQAETMLAKIKNATSAVAEKVEKKETKQRPKAPFTTVDLQSAASAQLRISPENSMKLAQGLFEAGLISYHRTDSVRLAPEFITEIRDYIGKSFGTQYLPAKPNDFKSKNSQADAHEGIRPTHMHAPSECRKLVVSENLTEDHVRLYELIYKRSVASQMADAVYDSVSYIFVCEGEKFKSTGRTLKFEGFLKLWQDSEEEKDIDKGKEEDEKDQALPVVAQNESVQKTGQKIDEGQTKPPARFSEASLVKELEKLGIGRPSTYASIIGVIKKRGYVKISAGRVTPEEIGFKLIDFLAKEHQWVVDYEMTRKMEEYLDRVEANENNCSWQAFVKGVHAKMNYMNPNTDASFTTPSDKQVQYAQSLADKAGIELTDAIKNDRQALASFIEKTKKSAGLSDSQMAIIEKNAPEDVIEKVKKGNFEAGRAFLDKFFKKAKSGSSKTSSSKKTTTTKKTRK